MSFPFLSFFVVPYRQGIDLAGFYGNWVLERKVWAGSQFDLNFWRGVEELGLGAESLGLRPRKIVKEVQNSRSGLKPHTERERGYLIGGTGAEISVLSSKSRSRICTKRGK